MFRDSVSLAFAAAVALVCPAELVRAEEVAPPRFEDTQDMQDLPARWAPLLEEFLVPGMAVAVVKAGKVHAVGTFGHRDAAREQPVTPDTMFYIASITKTYNAFLISMLAEQGKLSLDDPVKKWLPRFKLADTAATESITVRDLLTHKAGLNSSPIVTLDAYTGEITEDRFYHFLEQVTPNPEVHYTNLHYTLLGRVIEAVTGKPWRVALEEMVFKPAGMSRTTGLASRMYGDTDHADPIEWLPKSGYQRAELVKKDETMHAAGGLGTTAADGARWIMLNVNDGEIDGRRLLSAEHAAEMRLEEDTYPKVRGSLRIMTGHGLAWETGTFMKRPFCNHGGGYVGASAYVALLPEQKAGFFILMNTGGPAQGLGDVMAIDLLNRLTGENVAPNLLDGYLERVRKGKAEAEAGEMEDRGGALALTNVTAPPAEYARNFVNKDWGTLRVVREGDGLWLSLGSCALRVKAAGPDGFTVAGPIAEQAEGKFEKNPKGQVAAVKLVWPEVGEVVFGR